MNNIQSLNVCNPTILNKTLAGFTCILTVSAIALLIIGLTAPKGNPFNAISQLGLANNAILLGTSIFLLILNLVWLGAIKNNNIKAHLPVTQETVLPKSLDLTPTSLPTALTLLFLSYLDPEYLEQVAQSNGWKSLGGDKQLWKAFKLKKLFPELTMINKKFWQAEQFRSLEIDMSDIKPINVLDKRAMIPVFKILSSQVEGNAGMTLLTIPKGLSFNKLVTLAGSLVGEHGTIFRYIWQDFTNVFGNVEVDKTYRVVITNNVLLGSRNLSVQAQKDLVDKLGVECEFPKGIEMITLLIATLINSNKRLFNDNPWTFSWCQENIGGWQLIVGGFDASGFVVNSDSFDDEGYGLAGRREFVPGIDT